MAFRFAFRAKSAEAARALVEDANAPQQVKDFVLLAIQGIVMTGKPNDGIGAIVTGHLCDSPGSPDVSAVHVEVWPIVE